MIVGKLLGALFGFAWGRWLGALVGLYIGHLFDRGFVRSKNAGPRTQEQIQEAFFRLTFISMGYIAKADGRVSQQEIQWAEFVMSQMRLSPDMRRRAIEFFNLGKNAEVDLQQELNSFRRTLGRHATLAQMFLEIQIQAAYADGNLSRREMELLDQARAGLGISALRFEMIHGRIRAERSFRQNQSQGYRSGTHQGESFRTPNAREKVAHAYEVLGVKSSASDAEVKRAYRRLMSQHHPDKLVAKGLPEQMMEIAKEKTQEIQAAYEVVKAARSK